MAIYNEFKLNMIQHLVLCTNCDRKYAIIGYCYVSVNVCKWVYVSSGQKWNI